MAEAFGAKCYTDLNKRVTHVVAAKVSSISSLPPHLPLQKSNSYFPFLNPQRGTAKVDLARRQGGIKIVWVDWFTASVARWERQDETNYLMDPPPPPPPLMMLEGEGGEEEEGDSESVAVGTPASPHQISSDPEPDADDWDDDGRAGPDKDGEGEGKGEGNVDGEGVDREKGEKDGEGIGFDEHIWDDMNDEVEAAMNESDDDESVRTGGKSGNVSEDDWTDESNSVIRCVWLS